MKNAISIILVALGAICFTNCDSVSAPPGGKAIATKKMKEKVQSVQAALRLHCDSNLNREATRLADSIKGFKN